jgi:hypothetical protein
MTLSKFLAMLFVAALLIGLSVLVMMFGWGLEPKSWWWIIGAGIFGNTALRALAQKIEKD